MGKRAPVSIGTRFGRLVVKAHAEKGKGGKSRVLVDCDCGSKDLIRYVVLLKKCTNSCGCLARELTSARSKTHGLTYTPEWNAWRRMIVRTTQESHDSYEHYSACGIVVCDEWRNDFVRFLADMGPMPEDKRTIDRIDNAKGYEPGNCRWASVSEQNRNKTSNVHIEFNGRRMLAVDWARELGISQTGLSDRLKTMTIEEALTLPDQRGQRRWRKTK